MAFSSETYPDELIIDDAFGYPDPQGHATGLDLSKRPRGDHVYGAAAEPFPSELIIPRSEWQARIQELEERKSRISDICLAANLPCHDQDGVPYCWIHGPTTAVEIVRVVQNQPMVLLSATSAGCIIKNFKKQGGWGKEGLQFVSDRGLVPQSLWPENKLDRQYNTEANWQEAKKYLVTEWWELKPRNEDELISCLLRRIPVTTGHSWWAHQVCGCDAVWLDGRAAMRIRNSWGMGWGDKGFSILQGKKMLPDDAVAPRVLTAS